MLYKVGIYNYKMGVSCSFHNCGFLSISSYSVNYKKGSEKRDFIITQVQ